MKVIVNKAPKGNKSSNKKMKVKVKSLPKAQAGIVTKGIGKNPDPEWLRLSQEALQNKIQSDNAKVKAGFTNFGKKTKDFFRNSDVPFYIGSALSNVYSPNKYFAEGFQNLGEAVNIAGTINKPYYYNPNYSAYFGYGADGGMLPKAVMGGNGFNIGTTVFRPQTDVEGLYDSESDNTSMKQDIGGFENNPYQVGSTIGSIYTGNQEYANSMYEPKTNNPNQVDNVLKGITAGVKAIEGAQDVTKGFMDLTGTNLTNQAILANEAQRKRENLFAQYQNQDTRNPQGANWSGQSGFAGSYSTVSAADGMQIRQIGGYGDPNVEVEGDEHIQLPNGFSQEIKGKKHSEGGIPLNLPSGTKIFSEKLKLTAKFLQELMQVNPEYEFLKNARLPKKGSVSYADIAKKFETKKYVDILNSPKSDSIQKGTAKMVIDRNNQYLEKIFALQEQNKISGVHGPQVQANAQEELSQQEMKHGGLYMAANGTKTFTINGKTVTAKYFQPGKIPSGYTLVPGETNLYMKTTETTTPGKTITTNKNVEVRKAIPGGAPNKQWEDWIKSQLAKGVTIEELAKKGHGTISGLSKYKPFYKPQVITTTEPSLTTKAEDYVYTEEDESGNIAKLQDQTPSKQKGFTGIGYPMPPFYIDNAYLKAPITSYDVMPYGVQAKYINPYINDIQRAQYAANQNLGTTGAEMANRANLFGQGLTEYGKRYYDAAAFNAQAANQAALQNEQMRYQAGLQNRANQWAVDQAIAQREGAIEEDKIANQRAYITARNQELADRRHMQDTLAYLKATADPEVAKQLGILQVTASNLAPQEKSKTKTSKYGGKINIKKKRNRK